MRRISSSTTEVGKKMDEDTRLGVVALFVIVAAIVSSYSFGAHKGQEQTLRAAIEQQYVGDVGRYKLLRVVALHGNLHGGTLKYSLWRQKCSASYEYQGPYWYQIFDAKCVDEKGREVKPMALKHRQHFRFDLDLTPDLHKK